ncbi:class I glutamine amidotransferase-like protein [Lojkania enalia]|uniref:Class I glutamine amidotransferase-like protein n=1 Tax=Lojkania enalia TaxID=147567 RepID=A0A9P4K7S1_9PLEO|nr:class I glutamine amidotransferase-like protein [Didymosphaeria enalia]
MPIPNPPKSIGVVLFPGFQLLDVAGPLDILNILSYTHPITLSILSSTLAPVSTAHSNPLTSNTSNTPSTLPVNSTCSQSLVPTHTFSNPPADLEVLLVPGGLGSRDERNVVEVVQYLKSAVGGLRWCLTVCTGSPLVARAGWLEERRATTNKRAFGWAKQQHPDVLWIAKARWVVDGNVWTSSGISAGIDLMYAWVADVWGEEVAGYIADCSEYERNTDPENDQFAERWGAV